MADRWIISDTHFGHGNILGFTNFDGSPVRTFSCVEEMDQTMVDNWNRVVKPDDVVYHLGDVAIKKSCIATVARCNGSKRLIKGNHDIFADKEYLPYFKKIYAMRIFPNEMILTHVPIHPECIERFKVNCHGHIHCNFVNLVHGKQSSNKKDSRYFNACVEVNNYIPINMEEIRDKYK